MHTEKEHKSYSKFAVGSEKTLAAKPQSKLLIEETFPADIIDD